jgi:hypothetical protein
MSNSVPSVDEQFDIIDSWRNIELTDVDKVDQEMTFIMKIKEANYTNLIDEYITHLPDFYKNCPDLFKYVVTLRTDTIKDFDPKDGDKEEPSYFKDKGIPKKNVDFLKTKYTSPLHVMDQWVVQLLSFRIEKEKELLTFCKTEFKYVGQHFSTLLETCIKYQYTRHDEFKKILKDMLEKIKNVQDGALSQKECTRQILQDNLGKRFHKQISKPTPISTPVQTIQ